MIEKGFCECGCGRKAGIYKQSYKQRGIRRGDSYRFVLGHSRRRDARERFWEKVNKDGIVKSHMSTPCWEWDAAILVAGGYGQFWIDNTMKRSHRVAWEWVNGPIPEGMYICHHCDNPPCVNPEHLFLGDALANNADADRKGAKRGGAKGESAGGAKLTAGGVREIRELAKRGITQRVLGSMFEVSHQQIGHIVRREHWKHID